MNIPNDHPCFAGHFPGHPIVPGVLLLERVMSLARSRLGLPLANCEVYNVKFLAPVGPGDQINIDWIEGAVNEYRFAVCIVASADDEKVIACSGQLRIASNKS